MDNPIRTGAKFGLGFAIVFALVSIALELASVALIESLYPESSFGEPDVVQSEPTIRDGELAVLVTLRNTYEFPIAFDAEAVVHLSNDKFLDTCYSDRSFELESSAEVSFVAICSVDLDESPNLTNQIDRATVQFY